jgi:hypothetical protein
MREHLMFIGIGRTSEVLRRVLLEQNQRLVYRTLKRGWGQSIHSQLRGELKLDCPPPILGNKQISLPGSSRVLYASW